MRYTVYGIRKSLYCKQKINRAIQHLIIKILKKSSRRSLFFIWNFPSLDTITGKFQRKLGLAQSRSIF
jgi:hypothetical protein